MITVLEERSRITSELRSRRRHNRGDEVEADSISLLTEKTLEEDVFTFEPIPTTRRHELQTATVITPSYCISVSLI